jgi:23S rRNA (uracil1939-C5)-methyltransferase
MTTQQHDLTVTKFTYGGECLGRLSDGRAVFVPFTLPGEKVRVRLTEEKRRFARGELVEVLEPSPERIKPRCPHFTVCGGCHYQHMPYEEQLDAKRAILVDQLERIGKIGNPPVNATIPSPLLFNYRNQLQFQISSQGRLGFYQPHSAQVLEIQECHLPQEPIHTVWPQLQLESIPGLERVGIRLGSQDELLVALRGDQGSVPDLSVEDSDVSVVHLSPYGTQVLAGSDHLLIEAAGREFRVSADSFFQVNIQVAEALVDHILGNLNLRTTDVVLDVYAGVGLFSAFVAPLVGSVVGIEVSEPACQDYAINLDEFENVELYQAPVEIVVNSLEVRPDVIILDPPRAGIDRKVLDSLVGMKADTIVYVSCDPATMARDAQRLVKWGYQLEMITPFDMFPQTYHVESVGFWQRVQA